ncbi:hypothetical protein ACIA8K_11860 [Catenuloplanes sp. NPDC051500]|uniref:hypothetical protein n=1 Tax=Catenuloplanes sp. NPDC051500 TaxID=3363959 RepID=UPI0037B90D47
MDNRQSRWPADTVPRPPAQRDWRDTLRAATDLALAGILMTVAALPLVTAGTAVGTASAATAKYTDQERFPGVRECARIFGRGLLPGIPPLLIAVAAFVLLRLNIHALGVGLVPGGRPLIWATVLLGLALAGFAGLVITEFGRAGDGWRTATRDAARLTVARPALLAASTGIMAFTIGLGYLIQAILVPILAGYTLLALHVVRRRLADPAAPVTLELHQHH